MQNIQSTLIKGIKTNIWKTMGPGRERQTERTIRSILLPRSSSSFDFMNTYEERRLICLHNRNSNLFKSSLKSEVVRFQACVLFT